MKYFAVCSLHLDCFTLLTVAHNGVPFLHVCIYIYMRALVGVHMHSCRRILFICTVQSLYYMRVYHRCFLTLACVCVGGLKVGFVSACSWLALVTGVTSANHEGYLLAGVEKRVLSYIFFLFLRVLGWWVGVLVYVRTHTQTTWVLDVSPGVGRTPQEPPGRKHPDGLKRSTHVDRIGVQSTFDLYICSGRLTAFFLSTCLFFWEK